MLGTLEKINALNILIFEIANASQTKEFREMQIGIKNGTVSCDDYVKELERIEYTSGILHHKIVKMGIEKLKWSKELDTYKDYIDGSFEKAWSERIRFSQHAEWCRKQYVSIRNKIDTNKQ